MLLTENRGINMDANKIIDEIYDKSLEVVDRPRVEQIKRYIELYEQLKKED